MDKYDVVIVGAGLFGCVCANRLSKKGFKVLVIEKNDYVGGTCYTEVVDGIVVHKHGAHIFRTNDKAIFDYFTSFCELNHFVNSPIAICKGKSYNMPFNMNTFSKLWGVVYPSDAQRIISNEIKKYGVQNPSNLKEQAINLAGKTIFDLFIKGYTEKQWGDKCENLSPSIIKRLPLRMTYDNNYYDAVYQGIPIGGYTPIMEKMLNGSDVLLNVDFNKNREKYMSLGRVVLYTGPIDEFFDYKYGCLDYRGLAFIEKKYNIDNYQGNAVFNYSDADVPFTRSIEHKHFEFGKQKNTIVSFEYPIKWKKGLYPYYPINNDKNNSLYKKYLNSLPDNENVFFGGRLGMYKYFDMDNTISEAILMSDRITETLK